MKLFSLIASCVMLMSTAMAQSAPKAQVMVLREGSSFLGVGIQEIDAERAKALKLAQESGVEVTKVYENSPAEKGGVKLGDVIVDYNGQKVEGIEQFSRMVRETPVGRDVKLGLNRSGSSMTVVAKIGTRPSQVPGNLERQLSELKDRIQDVPRSFMSWNSGLLGVEAESLSGQLATYFGVKEGVLVRSVSRDSAAEKGGLRAGDVITKIDNATVSSPADVSAKARSLRGKTFPITVMRDKKEVTLNVTIANSGGSSEGPLRGHLREMIARAPVGYR